MTTVYTRAGLNRALTWVEADANFTNINTAKLENVVEDLTPQLGGDLDINGKSIISVSNGNINITPHGTGIVNVKGLKVGQGANNIATNSAIGTSALSVITTGANNSGFGYHALRDTSNGERNTAIGVSTIVRNNAGNNNTALGYNSLNYTVGNNNTAIGSASGSIIDGGSSNTLLGYNSGSAITTGSNNVVIGSNTGSTIATVSNHIIISDGSGNIRIRVDNTGAVSLGSLKYPTADGTNGQAIITNGSGILSFGTFLTSYTETDPIFSASEAATITSTDTTNWDNAYSWGNHASAGYLKNVVEDLTPQLGGNLDTNGNNITNAITNGNLTLTANGTGIIQLSSNTNIDGIATVDKLQVDTSVITGSTSVGQLAWNDGDGTLEFLLKGGNVSLQLGQEQVLRINNNTGSTLLDGQIVYINGSQGQLPTVALASAMGEETSSKTIGMVTETILNGADGFITTTGIVHDLDTIAYTAGTQLWLDTIVGAYSSTKPTSPNHGVFIGWVVRSHATSGSIYVHIQNGYELSELHDVLISNVQNNQILKYNGTSLVWENWTPNFLTSSDIGSTVQAYDSDLTAWAGVSTTAKQDTLISGTNIKTVNGNDLLGSGNIVISSGQGLGSIIAYKADGSQDNIDITANTTLTQIVVTQELLLDASAVIATETTSNYGWRDNIAPFVVKGTGVNNPSWITLFNGLAGLGFSATTMNEVWVDLHIDHDYALGTALYPHIHWTPTTTATGTVRWGVEYSVAKGHQQGASSIFPATTTVYIEQTISANSQWMHFIAEVSDIDAIPSTNVEPDTVIKIRIFRDAANAADTYPGTVHAWQADLHYRSNRLATLNKAPSFNG